MRDDHADSATQQLPPPPAAPPAKPFISRLVVFHQGLLPPVDGGAADAATGEANAGAHDESASAEELAEHVLYYYDAERRRERAPPRGDDAAGDDDNDVAGALDDLESSAAGRRFLPDEGEAAERRAREEKREELGEAARFAGLCAALRTLPSALREATASPSDVTEKGRGRRRRRRRRRGRGGDDFAEEVRMESSTLVFVPLETREGCEGLVAVAQVPRSSPSSVSSPPGDGGAPLSESAAAATAAAPSGVDPAAIRAAVARRHRLFSLTRGGGVDLRLRTDYDARGLAAIESGTSTSKKTGGNTEGAMAAEQEHPHGMSRSLSADSLSTLGTTASANTDRGGTRDARAAAERASQAAALAEETSGWSRRWKRASMDLRAPTTGAIGGAPRPCVDRRAQFQRRASLGQYENYMGDYDAEQQFAGLSSSRRESGSTAGEEALAPTQRTAAENLQRIGESQRTIMASNSSRRGAFDGGVAAGGESGGARTGVGEGSAATSSSPGSSYPGMARLYALRKDLRKLEARLTQRRIDSKLYGIDREGGAFAEEKKILTMERLERKLRYRISSMSDSILALGRLRKDLKRHYDSFVDEWEEARRDGAALFGPEAQTGVGRCVVELVPAPLSKSNGAFSRGFESKESVGSLDCPHHHPPVAPSPHEAIQLGQVVRSLLGEATLRRVSNAGHKQPPSSNILAVSTFKQNRLIHSHTAAATVNCGPVGSNDLSLQVDPDAACLLYEYFVSAQSRRCRQSTKLPSNDGDKPLQSGRLLSPPPPSNTACVPPLTLGECAENSIISLPTPFGDVWAPLIYLPKERQENGKDGKKIESMTPTRAVLYDCGFGTYCFILYLKDYSRGDTSSSFSAATNKTSLWSTLISATNRISSCLEALGANIGENMQIKPADTSTKPPTLERPTRFFNGDHTEFRREPAADMIYIDRSVGSLVLINRFDAPLDMCLTGEQVIPEGTNTQKPKGSTGSSWFSRKGSQENTFSAAVDGRGSEAAALGTPIPPRSVAKPRRLDCRHIMASHLPLDVILAFDEMFNEVDSLRSKNGAPCAGPETNGVLAQFSCEKVIEMCTFLPQGWAYCRCHGSRELYMLFDTAVYITLADVQKAALRVRQGLFNGALL